jgi:AcrR family transcriptional regulator
VGEARAGRKRSEASRQAILDGVFAIAEREGYAALTMDALAAEAGVGKQTLYRWWSSRAAIVLEALAHKAAVEIAAPNRGSLQRDLAAFLASTFAAASSRGTAELLRGLMVEAQLDPAFRVQLRASLIDVRRDALRAVFTRASERGELGEGADVDLAVDLAFGVLWYRLMLAHAPLDRAAGRRLAAAIARGVGAA